MSSLKTHAQKRTVNVEAAKGEGNQLSGKIEPCCNRIKANQDREATMAAIGKSFKTPSACVLFVPCVLFM
jgi:hypothetical protein